MINKYEARLGTERMLPLVFKMALPAVIAQFVNLLYSMVDRIYIGHIPGIGTDALAGVGVTTSLVILISSFSAIVGGGGAPLAAMALGQGDRLRAGKILGNGFVLLILFTLFTSFIAYTFMEPILLFTGASENTLEYAVDYLSIYLLGTVFVEISTGLNSFINAQGRPAIAMYSVLIGALLNIILDPIMIFGLLGCPAMGVRGAAIATVIGQIAGAIAALLFNRFRNPIIHVRLKNYHFMWQDVADIYRVGLPTIIMQAIGSIMTFVVNRILLNVSATAVAFFGIYYKLQNFLMMPINGLGQAAIPIVGYNYGDKNYKRVQQTWKILLPTGAIIALCGTVIFWCFPGQLLQLFSASSEMLLLGIPALRIISISFVMSAITILCGYFSSGLGNGIINMVGAAIRQLILLVPCLWIFIKISGISHGWYAFWIAEIIACIYSYCMSHRLLKTISQ